MKFCSRQVRDETFPDSSETETIKIRSRDRDVETETSSLPIVIQYRLVVCGVMVRSFRGRNLQQFFVVQRVLARFFQAQMVSVRIIVFGIYTLCLIKTVHICFC